MGHAVAGLRRPAESDDGKLGRAEWWAWETNLARELDSKDRARPSMSSILLLRVQLSAGAGCVCAYIRICAGAPGNRRPYRNDFVTTRGRAAFESGLRLRLDLRHRAGRAGGADDEDVALAYKDEQIAIAGDDDLGAGGDGAGDDSPNSRKADSRLA